MGNRMRLSKVKYFFYIGVLVITLYLIVSSEISYTNEGKSQLSTTRSLLLNKPITGSRQAVIIVTYMRSGSSLLGDILQQSPGAFYLYEPLHMLGRIYVKFKTNLTFVNGTERLWPFNFEEEGVNIIRHWLRCESTKVLKRSLLDGFMEKGKRSSGFRDCYRQLKSGFRDEKAKQLLKCAMFLKSKCEQSKLIIMKTIRLPIKAISQFLEDIPGLKIIHLIRDPRATLMSQSIFGFCSVLNGGFYGCANRLCTKLENDILQTERLSRKYPNRIKTVFYEDMAARPIQTSKDVYHFLNRNLTQHAKKYIFNITLAGNLENCNICTTRPNSSQHINSWKMKMKDYNLRTIEERCNYVIQRFNYTLYSNVTWSP